MLTRPMAIQSTMMSTEPFWERREQPTSNKRARPALLGVGCWVLDVGCLIFISTSRSRRQNHVRPRLRIYWHDNLDGLRVRVAGQLDVHAHGERQVGVQRRRAARVPDIVPLRAVVAGKFHARDAA